jgi:Tfp pilus assembly protein PilF
LPPARAAALKAVEMDPNLPEAHLGLASFSYNVDYDWLAAEREYKAALRLQPANATAHASYASCLSSMGCFAEALDEASTAAASAPSLNIDIESPVSTIRCATTARQQTIAGSRWFKRGICSHTFIWGSLP